MTRPKYRALVLCLGVAVLAAGCETTTGSRSETRIQLNRSAAISASLIAEDLLSDAPVEMALARIPIEDVAAIEVTIIRVQALPRGEDEDAERGWVTLDVTPGVRVNLLALPDSAEAGLEIARGELPAGTYGNLRFFVEEPTVTFARDVSSGGGATGRTYEAGTAHPLRIPSAAQAGIRVPAETFTVAEDAGATVSVLFESSATVRSIQTTGQGLQMSPVLKARSR